MNDRGTSPVDPYHAIAALYDLEHDPFQDDVDLLLSFAEAIGDPILEMGCGSGRILAPLADAGFRVVGIDQSATMLERARHRLREAGVLDRVVLVEGDMATGTPLPGGPFRMIMFTLNALMHLPTPEAQQAALAAAQARLQPGGQLILDLANPAPDYLVNLGAASIHEWSTTLDDGSVVDKWAFRRIHPVDQVIDTTLWYDEVHAGGELRRHRTRFDLRYLHPHELTLMLHAAGFGDIRMYGSYELDPLDDASDRILVTAEAPPVPDAPDTADSPPVIHPET